MKVKLVLLFVIGVYSPSIFSQSVCNCANTFQNLLQKVEANYIGLALSREAIDKEYRLRIQDFQSRIANTKEEDCTAVLQEFLSYFNDGHLFVTDMPQYSADELKSFKRNISEKLFSVEQTKRYLLENKPALASVEGIWTDGTSLYAIRKNNEPTWPYQFVAIILTHEKSEKAGELKFGLNLHNGALEGTYYTNAYAPRYVSVEAMKDNSLLSIWGGILWARVDFNSQIDLDKPLVNPLLPTVAALNTETCLITIPSFLIEKQLLDNVLQQSESVIKKSKYVIIDIRGNTGGNGIYFDLLRLFANQSINDPIGLALSSDDNIAYFEKFASSGRNNPYQPVVRDMKANPGKVVDGPRYQPMNIKPITSAIQKVVILTDKNNASAAESFILHAKQVSKSVITMGQPTHGVIDYQSINMVKIDCSPRGTHLGYPTSAATKELPAKGFNKTGLVPDVIIDKAGNDLIQFALENFNR